jgi:hypothetical protein
MEVIDALKTQHWRVLRDLRFDPQLVCHHRDELRVRGFALANVDRITEDGADGLNISASPSVVRISGDFSS